MTSRATAAPDVAPAACGSGADADTCRWLLEGAPKPEVDPALLEAIFADPSLAGARERGSGSLEHLWELLFDWLLSLVESSGAAGFAGWTRTLVLAGAVLLLVWLALRWIRGRRASEVGAPLPLAAEAAAVEVLDLPSRHLARGREATASAPREAIRQGLLALLSGLEDAGVIPPGRVRTNRELAQALPSSGASDAEVAGLTELLAWYDRAFYSLAAVAPAEANRFLDRIEVHLSGLGARAEAA